ncbi:hypothetical protein ACU686_40930 [Yinghuangia aomiensis]
MSDIDNQEMFDRILHHLDAHREWPATSTSRRLRQPSSPGIRVSDLAHVWIVEILQRPTQDRER